MPRPATLARKIQAALIQRPTAIDFHREHYRFGFRVGGHHNVDVAGANMRRD
jgi:hypothetical protein